MQVETSEYLKYVLQVYAQKTPHETKTHILQTKINETMLRSAPHLCYSLRKINHSTTPFWLMSWPLVARLQPVASTSSSVGLVRGHTCCPARVASCWRGLTCPYRLRDSCWFDHDDGLEGVPLCRDVAATSSLKSRRRSSITLATGRRSRMFQCRHAGWKMTWVIGCSRFWNRLLRRPRCFRSRSPGRPGV